MNVIETSALGKRYRNDWGLRDCTLAVPAGHITALVGPNGAGKTTLLHCAVGLVTPTTGRVTVLGHVPAGSSDALQRVAFVAQDAPLHSYLPVAAMLDMSRDLNRHFDRDQATQRLRSLEIPLHDKVGKLSGGQQAQLALTLAVARHPDLLVLDEPLARLDPLARHDFLAHLMVAVAEDGLSVVFSSHVVSELERVADYLVLLAGGRVQVTGVIDDLLATHAALNGPAAEADRIRQLFPVVQERKAGRRTSLLARTTMAGELPGGWECEDVTLEELILAYLREPSASFLPGPFPAVAHAASRVTHDNA
ncbi:MAG TPA: ABC transporter ATP-binding protein [Streptosporangiaceae bacterium]